MEDFLPMLRMRNIFKENPGSDRPFGMPDIDNGNIASMFRSVGPLADSMNQDDIRRKRSMMEFEQSLRGGPNLLAGRVPVRDVNQKKNVVYGGTEGFSPTQKIFQGERADERKQASEMEQVAQEFERRKELQGMDANSRLALERERAATGSAENERASSRRMTEQAAQERLRNEGDIARERARGTEARLTQSAKPPIATKPPTAKEQNETYLGRIQQLKIQDPALGALLVKDPNTEQWTISKGNENQKRRIKQYLTTGGFQGDIVEPVPGVDVPAGDYIRDDPSKRKPIKKPATKPTTGKDPLGIR